MLYSLSQEALEKITVYTSPHGDAWHWRQPQQQPQPQQQSQPQQPQPQKQKQNEVQETSRKGVGFDFQSLRCYMQMTRIQ